ncbi:MAG: polysaccharide deacetylase family protein [Terriglobales bacterium]
MIKKQLKQALLASGILRLAGRFQSKGAAILMYHSVLDDPNSVKHSLGGIIHARSVFAAQMELIAGEFHPVSLDQVARFVRGEQDIPERPVVVTFDDGYTDNYEVAMPTLDHVGVPATFYATVDCVEDRRLPWPSRLRFSFETTSKSNWADETGKAWTLTSPQERDAAYLAVCDRVAQSAGAAQERMVRQIELELDKELTEDSGQLMMTWDQLRALVQHGHNVGSHTMTHPNLAYLSIDDVRRELVESKQRMEAQLRTTVAHLSYPCPALFPNWTEQTADESRRAGYETAVTTSGGLARRHDNPLALKRVRPTKTVDGLRWNLESAFAGRAV